MGYLHPLLVHFPIALWSVYCALEILVPRKFQKESLRQTKALLVTIGTLGAVASLRTGEVAAEAFSRSAYYQKIIYWHENFAKLSTLLFTLISAIYIVNLIAENQTLCQKIKKVAGAAGDKIILVFSKLEKRELLIVLSALGFMAISATGALGGFMVHGQGADPFSIWLTEFLVGAQ